MKKLIRTCVTAAVLITALMFIACPDPNGDGDTGDTSGKLTKIAVNPSVKTISLGEEFTLQAVKTPTAAAATITWTSEDPAKVSVDAATGKIKGEAFTSAPVRITAASVEHPEISGYCDVSVTVALRLITNAAEGADMADTSQPDRTLPEKVNNIYNINSFYSATNSKLPDSSSGFKDTTFVYIDKLLQGDFKLSVRVRMTATPATNSTAKGIIIGAFTPVGGIIGETSNIGGIVYRCSNGSGANPYNIRSMVSKTAEQASVAGFNNTAGKTDEYIFEVTRTEAGYLTEYFVSKTNEKIDSATVSYTDRAENAGADKPVFAGLAFASVKVAISQITLWDGELTGDPIYSSGVSAAAPVKVAGIKIGVQGAGPGAVTGEGTADNPAAYIARQSAVTGGIQLVPEVIPSYADNTAVKYFLSPGHTSDTTITVDQTTGMVSVTGTGSATIQAISQDEAEPEFYLTITVTPDYVPVEDFNIVAQNTAMLVLGEIPLSTDISPVVTSPEVTWTTDDSTTIVFVSGETTAATVTGLTARIKGLKAGTATITATAVTTNSGTQTTKTATQLFTVNSTAGAKLEWKFDSLPLNWTENTNFSGSDVDYNGLTLTASTRSMKIVSAGTASGTDFSPGYLQPGGQNKFAVLSDVQGPFTIKLNYSAGGDSARYPGITISGQPKITAAPPSTGTSDFKTYEYNYTGTDEVDIEFTSEGNAIRLYDLIIQF